jgi:hypothetical protein
LTLPTIAVIVTTPAADWNQWRYQILCLFLASAGLLLASVQLSVGRLFKDARPWNEFRAVLTFLGLICLALGLALLAASQLKADKGALIGALVVFALGVLVPVGISLRYWYADSKTDIKLWLRRKLRLAHDGGQQPEVAVGESGNTRSAPRGSAEVHAPGDPVSSQAHGDHLHVQGHGLHGSQQVMVAAGMGIIALGVGAALLRRRPPRA